MPHRNKKFQTGFTIVELVIVIAVIAILAAVLIPTFAFMIKRAEESRDLQESENQAKQDFADSMLGGNGQSSSEQNPEETEPEETTPERIDRDVSELVHINVVPVIEGDKVLYNLVYYMNRNGDNADIIDTVLKDATIYAKFNTHNLVIDGKVTLFEYGENGFSENCFTPQTVTLATDYWEYYPEDQHGYLSLTIKAEWPDNRYEDILGSPIDALIVATDPGFIKTNGEFLFGEAYASAYDSVQIYDYYTTIEQIYEKLNATESES